MEILGPALGLVAGTWFQFLLLLLFLNKYPELRKSFLPLRSILLYLIASGGMSIFIWLFEKLGVWNQGPFLMQNWIVFTVLVVSSSLIYLIVLLLFREENLVRISIQLKSRIGNRKSKK